MADTLAYDLPRTVRESAIRAVMQIRSWKHRAASNRAVVQENGRQVQRGLLDWRYGQRCVPHGAGHARIS